MREEELLPAVHTHLGSLPLRLKDNVRSQFDYTPMAPMTYAAVKGELWCHRCDQRPCFSEPE
jgi:DnaJ family protein C protein 13